jgi:hypothetical protein
VTAVALTIFLNGGRPALEAAAPAESMPRFAEHTLETMALDDAAPRAAASVVDLCARRRSGRGRSHSWRRKR